MTKTSRYLKTAIAEALAKKMVFIGGPRQVGKTTLALSFLSPPKATNSGYLNWDRASDQKRILTDDLPATEGVWVLDEIHKYRFWRQLTKGLYDKYNENLRIIVTGSARLDHFRKGGDSLLGRYRYFRLHPFSVSELGLTTGDLPDLMNFGGFPEPIFERKANPHRIWLRERSFRLVNDDVRDLSTVKDLSLIALLMSQLPGRVGAPLSLKALSEDVSVSQPTIERWLLTLENMYYCYRLSPFGAPKVRAVKKLQKLYLWDWSEVQNEGAKFENMVAGHLLKYCHYLEDTTGHVMEVRYLRDIDGREIDFVVLKDHKPLFAVECKTGQSARAPHLEYFRQRTSIPEFYQVHMGTKSFGSPKTGMVLPFVEFCSRLSIP